MGLVEDVLAVRTPRRLERLWPVGAGAAPLSDRFHGHDDSRFSPEEYGDSLATSNDVYSVVARRARLMSGLRLRFYRGRANDKKEVKSHPAVDLYWRVNDFWTAERLARMDEMSMGVWGETYWALEGPRGNPGEIWWMKPSRVKPVVDEKKYLQGFLYEPQYGGPVVRFEPREVIWFRYPNPIDEFSALSPLAAAKLAAETASAMMTANRDMHRNGLQLAGVVVPTADKVTFSPEQAEELEGNLLRRFQGADKAHRWAVMRYEAQFKALGITPKDAEFVTGLGMTFRQVCRAYGMQPMMLGDGESSTLTAARELERVEWDGTLRPDAEFRAAEIREQYLPKFTSRAAPDWCEHDYSTVSALQESATDSWGREAQALDRGAITINEWRRTKGMPDVPWGDEPWLPLNKAQYIDGQLVVSQTPVAAPAPGQVTADGGPAGVPDDERNPANSSAQVLGETVERGFDHHAARRLIAEAFGDRPRVNGYAHSR